MSQHVPRPSRGRDVTAGGAARRTALPAGQERAPGAFTIFGHVTFVSLDSALENSLDPRPERQLRQFRPRLRPTGHEALFSAHAASASGRLVAACRSWFARRRFTRFACRFLAGTHLRAGLNL